LAKSSYNRGKGRREAGTMEATAEELLVDEGEEGWESAPATTFLWLERWTKSVVNSEKKDNCLR
jgi:hypothetical protein